MTLQALIDKQDAVEIVRDQIAALLKLEFTNQMALATQAGKDPTLWDVAVYSERSNPWEQILNDTQGSKMWVNVWWDASNFNKSASDPVKGQKSETVFNVDCYGSAVAADDGSTGQLPGDREAAFVMQRCVRLVRNILMAGENTYLQLRKTVWGRWINSATTFQPQMDGNAVQQAVAARLSFGVDFSEFSPQYEGQPLELLTTQVERAEDGEIIVVADFDYSTP